MMSADVSADDETCDYEMSKNGPKCQNYEGSDLAKTLHPGRFLGVEFGN